MFIIEASLYRIRSTLCHKEARVVNLIFSLCTVTQVKEYSATTQFRDLAKMGMVMSFMGGGSLSSHVLHMISGTLYEKFVAQNIQSEEQFHIAILDIFNTLNSALPGKHYDAPQHSEVEEVYGRWIKADNARERRNIFVEFMKTKVSLNKIDKTTMITGVVTPPVAMAAKRAGENVPQLKMIKAIPDVFFVPSATMVALFSVKISRRVLKSMAS